MYLESMIVDSQFFESIDTYQHDTQWQTRAMNLLAKGASIFRWSFWVQVTPPGFEFAEHGFKIHISPDIEHIDIQFDAVLAILVRAGVSFKFVADMKLLRFTNGKNFGRSASGKFFTIYPSNDKQFRTLANDLSEALASFHGPYILTDRPIPGSKCVFYRYGGHKSISVPNGEGGSIMLIQMADGSYKEDIREPRFYLPEGISDPYIAQEAISKSQLSLKSGRYKILNALHFSNSGGIYKALDNESGEIVTLKEARRQAGVRDGVTAQEALKHEFAVLQDLNDFGGTPKVFDIFEEWESLFLVEEYLPMTSWHNIFVIEKYFLGPFARGVCKIDDFLELISALAVQAIDILQNIHSNNYVLGDVSTNNIMVDPSTKTLRFIDVESAIKPGDPVSWQGWWNTPGFARAERGRETPLVESDDWYGLGKCLVSAVMTFGDLTRLGGMGDVELVDLIEECTGLPQIFGDAILDLLGGDALAARLKLSAINDLYASGKKKSIYSLDRQPGRFLRRSTMPSGVDNLSFPEIGAGIADFLIHSYRGPDAREIWPADPSVYACSRLSIAYGATGIASTLHRLHRELPPGLQDFLTSHEPTKEGDIGLFTGTMGLAYYNAKYGAVEHADRLLEIVEASEHWHASTGILSGQAGIGTGALSIYRLTGSQLAIDIANRAADYLVDCAINDALGGCYWELSPRTKSVHYGYMTGCAGVAFYLAEFGLATKQASYIEAAKRGIEFVISKSFTDGKGNLQWGKNSRDARSLPYFAYGAAGVGSVLGRLGMQLAEPEYSNLALSLVDSAFTKLASCIGQFDGLAGIADFLVDLRALTGRSDVSWKAGQVAEGITKFGLPRKNGIAFPGWLGLRVTCDFATGSAGVATALDRVSLGGEREFFDFALPSCSLFDIDNRVKDS